MSSSRPELDVFLCHSDCDKDFVHQLHVDLRRHNIASSFDKNYHSYSEDTSYKVAVLIYSPDFFNGESKRPPVELAKIVQAWQQGNLQILPLFYLISCQTLYDKLEKGELSKHWEEGYREDLKRIKSVNGLNSGVNEESKCIINEVDYRELIVKEVIDLLRSNPSFDVSHVEGRDRLCSEIDKMFRKVEEKDGVKVLGLHGNEGCGKTTISKCLYNFYKSEYKHKVFHFEFRSKTSDQTRKRLLQEIAPNKALANEDQEWDILRERMKDHKVFLALDNAEDNYMAVKSYLTLGYKGGSKIVVTSRHADNFESDRFGQSKILSEHVPRLEEDEAINILLNGKLVERKNFSLQQKLDFRKFATKCIVSDVYSPSALKKMCEDLCAMFGGDPTKWEEIPNLVDLHSVTHRLRTYCDLMTSYLKIGKNKPALYLRLNLLFTRIYLNDLFDIQCFLLKNFLIQLLNGTESKGLVPFLKDLLKTDECKQLLDGSATKDLTSIIGEVLNTDFKELLTGKEIEDFVDLLVEVLLGKSS